MVSTSQVIEIARNVTGRVDSSDPLFTDAQMLERLNQFIVNQSSIEVRLFKNYTWYTFPTVSGQDVYPIDLQTIVLDNGNAGASTISSPIYVDGFVTFWYQDPREFYYIWPETQTYTPTRPTHVLYYNNELIFRAPPDDTYTVKLQAYSNEIEFPAEGEIPANYLYRYIAYGMALDIFSDYGEMDKYNEIFPVFRRYRALVQSRTWQQFINERTAPQW